MLRFRKGLRERWPLLVAIATSAGLAVALWPELSIGRSDLNDHVYHLGIIVRMAEALAGGGNPLDLWISEWSLGHPVPRIYQPLGHLVVALLHASVLRFVDLETAFIGVRTALLVLFPLTVFASARIMRASPGVAAAAAAISPLLATGGWYGIELGSHAWRGSGLYAQAWGMHLLALSLALSARAMRDGRRLWLAALALSATLAAHVVYGYMGALSVVLLAMLPDEATALARRLARLGIIGVLTAASSAWLILPMIQDAALINHSQWEEAWKWNSVGLRRVAGLLASGKLLDEGRWPAITLLAAIGLVACAVAWRRQDASVERFVLAGSALWLLLFAGRPQWGPLLELVGLGEDVPLHRLIGGAHLFLIFAAAIGLATIARALHQHVRLPAAVAGVLAALVLVPAWRERHAWCATNETWGRENLAARAAEGADVAAAVRACAERGGRAFPGLAATWARQIKIGYVPLYAFFSMERVPAVAFLYHAMSLPSDIMVRFDEKNPAHYRAFGVTSVAATDAQALPEFLTERARFGRFRVLDAPGGGLFDVVDVVGSVACDRNTFRDVAHAWMQSQGPAQGRHVALDLVAPLPAGLPRLAGGAPPPAGEALPLGAVISETREGEVYSARVSATAPAWVLFKMTFHPQWRIEVDGAPQPIVHVTPGFMAARVEAGEHDVRCAYVPGRGRLLLLVLLTPLALVAGWAGERRGLTRALEGAVESRWRSPLPALAARPRLATALLLVAVVTPICLPLLKGELTGGHDHAAYLPRLVEFHENIRHGILLPRWAPDLSAGHGQPLFIFAPPMLVAIAEIFYLAGLGIVWSLNLAVVALIVASAFAMHRFASFHFGRQGGWLAATAYVWAPYFCTDLFVRHAMAEFAAFAFYPIALDGLSRLAAGEGRRHATVAGLGVAGVVLCHPPAALLFMPIAAAFAAFLAWRARSVRLLAQGAGAIAMGLALSASAWLPALAERDEVRVDRLLEGYLRYSNHFVHPGQLLWSPWGFGLSVAGPEDGMSFAIGWAHLLIAALALALLVRSRSKLAPIAAFFASGVLVLAFLMTPASQPVWDRLELLQHVEFPWRLLAPATTCLAVLVGAWAAACDRPRRVMALIALLMIVNMGHAWPKTSERVDESLWTAGEIARRGVSVVTREEYEPRAVTRRAPFNAERAAFVAGAGTIRAQAWTPERARLQVSADEAATLEFRVHRYPGWTAFVDGRDVPITTAAETGFMRVPIPPGDHEVTLVLLRTPAQRAALALMLVGAVAAVALALAGARQALARRRAEAPSEAPSEARERPLP